MGEELAPGSADRGRAQSGRVALRDARGHTLTPEELEVAVGSFRCEVRSGESVPPEAENLHKRARDAGARGDYPDALTRLTKAADLAPRWPYPVYDRAYTQLLMKNLEAAFADYRKTIELAPRGFFTALTALDTLTRE